MPNIFDFDRLYRRKATGVGVDGEIVRVYLEKVKAKTLRCLTHVTAENTTDDYDLLRIGIENTGARYYLDELVSPTEDELAVCRSEILLGEGDRFFAEFDSAATGSQLILTAIGWTKDLKGK